MSKVFKEEFYKFKKLLSEKVPFSFSRFSDGEFFILTNQEVRLSQNDFVAGPQKGMGIYTKEEQKHFLPGRDEFYRQELLKTFKHEQNNYFKGICTISDISKEDFDLQMSLLESKDTTNLTYSNLFINTNYPLFMNEIVFDLFRKETRPIAFVLNEACDTSKLPFKISKEFRIGNNCLVNNYQTAHEVAEFLENKEGWLVLASAASLSNLICYYSFIVNSNNTIIDIGSSLNPLLGLEGWKYSRGYLRHYWLGIPTIHCTREDLW